MRSLSLTITASLLLLLALQSCATTDDFVRSGSEGTSRVYPITVKQAWDITEVVFRWEGADNIKEDRKEDYMVASVGTGVFSYDAAICAWMEPVDSENTMITLASKRKDLSKATAFTQANFYWRFS
ncbi:MAG: hypothetical protein P8013_07080 [Candidatus Sulfobium sp.]|jgi:hypothetical protein